MVYGELDTVVGVGLRFGFMYVTVKLEPSPLKEEVETKAESLESTIITGVKVKLSIAPDIPFIVVVQLVTVASPKLANVLIVLLTVGRSIIHSADFIEELYVTVFRNSSPVVSSVTVITQVFLLSSTKIMDVVILSPG
jgi:hypothetical protein